MSEIAPGQPEVPERIPDRDWLKATAFVLVTAVVLIGVIIWFVMTFVAQTCSVPTCGLPAAT